MSHFEFGSGREIPDLPKEIEAAVEIAVEYARRRPDLMSRFELLSDILSLVLRLGAMGLVAKRPDLPDDVGRAVSAMVRYAQDGKSADKRADRLNEISKMFMMAAREF